MKAYPLQWDVYYFRSEDPEKCIRECRRSITNWTKSLLEGERWRWRHLHGWQSHEDAITAWKNALDYWEKQREQKRNTAVRRRPVHRTRRRTAKP